MPSGRWKIWPTLILLAGCQTEGGSQPSVTPKQIQEQAFACSITKAREYALSSQEPADLVAKAAYHACFQLWDAHVEAMCRDPGLCNVVFKNRLRAQEERAWIDSETPDVIEVRGKAVRR